jgi:hypothetical protein
MRSDRRRFITKAHGAWGLGFKVPGRNSPNYSVGAMAVTVTLITSMRGL